MIFNFTKRPGATTTVNINGMTYSGGNISINGDGTIIVDGKPQAGQPTVGPITVTVNGNCDRITTASGNVEVKGSAGSINTASGDVSCLDVHGSISTASGDVVCKKVSGSVKTMSGDIITR